MMQAWDQLEGVYVAGQYALRQRLGEDKASAWFLTTFGPQSQRALLKLVPRDPSTAEEQLDQWQRTARLSHANLLPLLDCGRTQVSGDSLLYAVFEYPDDCLGAARQNGPLTEAEAHDVLKAAIEALRYLHSQGVVHSAVDPDHIVAVGDRIKLASDTLRDAGGRTTPAEDIRALGAMLYELLTTRRLDGGSAPDLSGISEPLRTIIRHSLDPQANQRWTAEEIADALNAAAVSPERRLASPPAPPAKQPETPKSVPKWTYPAAAVLLTAVIVALTHRSAPAPDEASVARPAVRDRAAPVPAAASPPVASSQGSLDRLPASEPPPAPSVPQPEPAATEPAPRASAHRSLPTGKGAADLETSGRPYWRVIAYTYSRFQDAQRKAHSINGKWPDLRAEVFTPKGQETPPYLVALGGRMSRAEAIQLQHEARAKGLARDTYFQNYSK